MSESFDLKEEVRSQFSNRFASVAELETFVRNNLKGKRVSWRIECVNTGSNRVEDAQKWTEGNAQLMSIVERFVSEGPTKCAVRAVGVTSEDEYGVDIYRTVESLIAAWNDGRTYPPCKTEANRGIVAMPSLDTAAGWQISSCRDAAFYGEWWMDVEFCKINFNSQHPAPPPPHLTRHD